MIQRIQYLLKSLNLSPSKFAEEIGVQRSNISHILSGRNNPGLDFVQKILTKYPKISSEWLVLGKGNIYKSLELFDNDTLPPAVETKIEPSFIVPDELYKDKEPKEDNTAKNESSYSLLTTNNKTIEKIIILYSDHSFKEYKPE